MAQLEASNLQKTSLISDLQHELTSTKARLDLLDAERRALENETLSLADRSQIMIKSLEKQVQTLNADLTSQKQTFESRFESTSQQHTQTVEGMKFEFQLEKQNLIDKYEERLATAQVSFDEKVLDLEVGLKKGFGEEVVRLTKERNEFKEALDKLTSESLANTKR